MMSTRAPLLLLLPLALLLLLLLLLLLASGGSTAAASADAPLTSSSSASAPPRSSRNDWCAPGLECPRFDLLEVAGAYQVRRYEPAAWAVTIVRSAPSLQAAQVVGLARLARYWKGDNDRGRPLPPTAPLVTALFPTKGARDHGRDDDGPWSAEGVFVVAAPLPASEAHYPPKPPRGRGCAWGDPDARRGDDGACRVRVVRSGAEGGCRNDDDDDDGGEVSAWLAEAAEALASPMTAAAEGGGGDEGGDEGDDDDPPCFLDGPNGDCSEEEDVEDDAPDEGGGGGDDEDCGDDPNRHDCKRRRRRHRRRRRAEGSVVYASAPFDGFPAERDALDRARALRLALRADRRPFCRRVFFLAAYSPPWQLVLRRNEVWVPSCGGGGGGGKGGRGAAEDGGAPVAAS